MREIHARWMNLGKEFSTLTKRPCASLAPRLDPKSLVANNPTPDGKMREIAAEWTGETSVLVRERVVTARRRQQERFAGKRNVTGSRVRTRFRFRADRT